MGLTPKGNLYLELFIERRPTPTKIRHKISSAGQLVGDPIAVESRIGFVREIECGLLLDMNTAKVIRDWLTSRIEEFDKLTSDSSGK